MTASQIFVGVDASKAQLDIAIRPQGRFAVANTEAGVAPLIERVNALPAGLVVLEATGGLEIPLAGALALAGVPVVVANPRQVGPRLCQSHRAVGEYRCPRCRGVGPVCRGDSAGSATVAQ